MGYITLNYTIMYICYSLSINEFLHKIRIRLSCQHSVWYVILGGRKSGKNPTFKDSEFLNSHFNKLTTVKYLYCGYY